MNYLPQRDPERYGKAFAMLATGSSICETAEGCRISNVTASRIRVKVRALFAKHGKEILCDCGQPAGHNGWCRPRFLRSPKRQAALAILHARQRTKKK